MKTITLTFIALFISLLTSAQLGPDVIYPKGDGNPTQKVYPFDGSYGYSYHASIYNKENIGVTGTIEQIAYFVAAPCNDSVTVTIRLEEVNNAVFGGNNTFGIVSMNGTLVFQQKVLFNNTGWNYFNLDNDFDYDSSYHLAVYISTAWGGTGPTTVPEFGCENITTATDYVALTWGQDNSFPTSMMSQLSYYRPVVLLKFDSPQPSIISGTLSDCGESVLTAAEFGVNDNLIVVYNYTGTFDSPYCGQPYLSGDTLSDGSEIIYNGPTGQVIHTGIESNKTVYYKTWSYDEYLIYSATGNVDDLFSQRSIPFSTNFDGGPELPDGFSGGWENLINHGLTDQGVSAELTPAITVKHLYSPHFCGLTSNSILTFDYRIVNISGYPNTATPASEIDSINIKINDPISGDNVLIHSINPANHIASSDFVNVEIPIGAFTGGMTYLYFSAYSGTGSYFVDIDNFAITDPSAIDDNEQEMLNIYPNPASNNLNVVLTEAGPVNIYDITGRIIIQVESNGNETLSIDISGLNSGFYLIESGCGKVARFFKN